MRKECVITLFLMMSFILITVPNVAQAKDNEMKSWLEESLNPSIDNVVRDFNKITKEYWYLNLSNYLLEMDKDTTIQGLTLLREEIKTLKKDLKNIKLPKTADRKDKKSVKSINKDLSKALNKMDRDAKKLIKRISKDKNVKEVKNKEFEEKRIERVNSKYLELNKKYSIEVDELKFNKSTKINKNLAKDIISKHKKEIQKAEKKKEKKLKEHEEKEQKERDAIEKLPIEKRVVEKFEIVDSAVLLNDELTLVKEPGFSWDETTYVSDYALDMFKAMKEGFSDSSVNKITSSMNADLINDKGHESAKEVVMYSYERKTFESLDYDNFIKLAFGEEWRIFKESDEYSIRPALYWEIDEKYRRHLYLSE